MKKFISQVGIFISITSIVILIMVVTTIAIMKQASFKIDTNKNILILGSCFTEISIDDRIFERSANLSQTGTAYIYSYCKLKKVLEINSHIDTVLVSFQYGELSKSGEDIWIMSSEFMFPKVAFYISLLGKEEFAVYKDKGALFQAILQTPVRNVNAVIKYFRKGNNNYTYKDLRVGSYLRLDRDRLQVEMEIWEKNKDKKRNEEESPLQKRYLQKIANLCNEHNVKLILVNTPVYQSKKYDDNVDKLYEYRNKYLRQADLFDYSNFSLPDSCRGDIAHLNYKGAKIFSEYLQAHFHEDAKACADAKKQFYQYNSKE
ncbi:hypothetical protein EZS27_004458 [termite gut metagenome]|uniref:SGNH/GDSL hydrolase family protein n=1 Tax=termite gut metagenome TaxID=433724 RepID=A0A5J4SPD6_9ZZZZ